MLSFIKLKCILGISLVFLLVLATNLIDRQHFREVKHSMETLYADRLVAQDIIYGISKIMLQKESAYGNLEGSRLADRMAEQDRQIALAINRFSTTRLTEREQLVLNKLQGSLKDLRSAEEKFSASSLPRAVMLDNLAAVHGSLDELSAIQMEEGRRQLLMGQNAISSVDWFTRLEVGILIVLALAIQLVILYPQEEGKQLAG